ncbi:hypothetical protein DZS_24350 [Dickeya ananatis]
MSPAVRSSLGIQMAPAFVACSAWLSVNGGQVDVFAKLLFDYGLFFIIALLIVKTSMLLLRGKLIVWDEIDKK